MSAAARTCSATLEEASPPTGSSSMSTVANVAARS